jgi:D-sedoheptulose 7-phosphate isomerase
MNKNELIREIESCYSQVPALKEILNSSKSCIILGNGGSSAIASHISQDYTKFLKLRTQTFSDASRLTCYSNDYGYENAYSNFINDYAEAGDVVILISSSGNSKNIINAALAADKIGCKIVTLTGFNEKNPLRLLDLSGRKLDVHVDSESYGIVENVHQVFLHAVIP